MGTLILGGLLEIQASVTNKRQGWAVTLRENSPTKLKEPSG